MKTVFSNREIAHVFASNTQKAGRTSNRTMFFEDGILYSYGYHFPMAKIVADNVVLFTTRSYSITTAKHLRYARQALGHYKFIYCYNPGESHTSNFEHWYGQITKLLPSLKKARKPQKYLDTINNHLREAKEYAEYFNIELPKELSALIDINNLKNLATTIVKADKEKQERIEAEEKARKERHLAEHKEALKAWRKFKRATLYSRVEQCDYLRFKPETNRIQTSQGIEIPLATAKDLFSYIMETVKNGGCTDCKKVVLDRYQVRSISTKDVRIGCHTILISEIKKVAKTANII